MEKRIAAHFRELIKFTEECFDICQSNVDRLQAELKLALSALEKAKKAHANLNECKTLLREVNLKLQEHGFPPLKWVSESVANYEEDDDF